MNLPRFLQWLWYTDTDRPWLLDLFCGAGGAAVGYWRAGFNVVGVDIAPQPHYPFWFVQGDALEFASEYGSMFDVIHASPPCQRWSVTANLPNVPEYPDLIEPTRKELIRAGSPYVIENVPGAPLNSSLLLRGDFFGLRVLRDRVFECSPHIAPPALPLAPVVPFVTTNASKGYSSFEKGASHISVAGNNYAADDGRLAMGIQWMTSRAELSESIPPAYTEYIGKQLIKVV